MKNIKIGKILLGAVSAFAVPLTMATSTYAWGPERDTYTNASPAPHATFNSITDNVALGDERDFVRIVEQGTGNDYVSELTIEPNKTYEVYIYYHNDAATLYNSRDYNYIGLAEETRLSSVLPSSLSAGERQAVTGRITSTTTTPASVWDEAWITASEDMTLHYVAGTAKIYNQWGTNGTVLSTALFSTDGTLLGTNDLNGLIPGCAEFSGHVIYYFETRATNEPDTPVTPPETPETPPELPTTGPFEIILAVVILLIVAAAVTYWHGTSQQMKKMSRSSASRKKKSRN